MRVALGLVAVLSGIVGCVDSEPNTPTPPAPIDAVWAASIHAGDLFVMVPGTGSYQWIAQPIEAIGGTHPTVDVRQNATVAGDAVVFEQAIASAHRAGFSDADITAGKVEFGLWGAGFTTVTAFDYISYEGITLHVAVLGGENSCATGDILVNLLNYTTTNANTDANNVYADVQTWLAANPSPTGSPRNVIVAAHSWGGAVAEYLALNLSKYVDAHGMLADTGGTAQIDFTVAQGVPGFILEMTLEGPGLRPVGNQQLLEIDRPDDPVHAMDPSGNGGGHDYTIVVGEQFYGSYGITTMTMDCDRAPGECPPSS
jgi:hypothetical protein